MHAPTPPHCTPTQPIPAPGQAELTSPEGLPVIAATVHTIDGMGDHESEKIEVEGRVRDEDPSAVDGFARAGAGRLPASALASPSTAEGSSSCTRPSTSIFSLSSPGRSPSFVALRRDRA